jgi:hypothetical protein
MVDAVNYATPQAGLPSGAEQFRREASGLWRKMRRAGSYDSGHSSRQRGNTRRSAEEKKKT